MQLCFGHGELFDLGLTFVNSRDQLVVMTQTVIESAAWWGGNTTTVGKGCGLSIVATHVA